MKKTQEKPSWSGVEDHAAHIRMKDLPIGMRPYEKCERLGAKALGDAELLAVILQSGTKEKSALQVAEALLCMKPCESADGRFFADSGTAGGLLNLKHGSPQIFQRIPGIGPVKAMKLACIAELSERIWRERQFKRLDLKSPETVADFYREELRHLNQERVCIMLLDGRDAFLGSLVVSQGTVNLSVLSPREIFHAALLYRAAAFLLVHNHPSGDVSPSTEDVRFTTELSRLARMMNIPLRDSLIVGDSGYYSFLEAGML